MVCEIDARLMVIVKEGGRGFQYFDTLLLLMVSTHFFWLLYKAMFIMHRRKIMISDGHNVLKPGNKAGPFNSPGSADLGPLMG
jgi:hypothetical protein